MKMTPPARPVKRRLQFPNNKYDALGVVFVVFGGFFLLWYEICHILPTYYSEVKVTSILEMEEQEQLELFCHYVVAIFLAVNIYGNMYKVITTDTSKNRYMFMSSSLLPDGWRYCSECDLNLPPRSHHCKLCNICILKRDHHCWFTGCCIGYFNHRYYVAMVTHMFIAALYCNIFNLTFVVSVKGGLTLYTFLSYVGPHMGWLLGYYDLYVFAITILTSVGTVLLGLLSWLLYIQIYQITFGQTNYEKKKNVKKYNVGIMHNIKEVLGCRWYLVLLFPWIPSPLIGSGTQFKVKEE
jgi:palmitoyltransferase